MILREAIQSSRGMIDEASFEDIQYHVYVRQKVRNGLRAADEGRLISQAEMEKRMTQWIGKLSLKYCDMAIRE